MATGVRNTHRPGDYLVVDDSSGLVEWRSDCVIRWDGMMVRADQNETRHPQEFVRARPDPRALKDIRPSVLVTAADSSASGFVGDTGVVAPVGPATHVFLPVNIEATVGACVLATPLGVSFSPQTPVVQIIVPPGVSVASTAVGISVVAVSGVAVSAVDPATPPEGNLTVWLRGEDIVADSGGLASDWPDRTSNALDFTQATTAKRMQIVSAANLNGHRAVYTNKEARWLGRSTTPALTQPYTYVIVADSSGGGSNGEVLMASRASQTAEMFFRSVSGEPLTIFTTSPSPTILQGTGDVSAASGPGVYIGCFNTAQSFTMFNWIVDAEGNAGTGGTSGLMIGNDSVELNAFNGAIAEALVYNSRLTASQLNELAIYANERYGFDKPIPSVIGIPAAKTESTDGHTMVTVSAHVVEANTKAIVLFVGSDSNTGTPDFATAVLAPTSAAQSFGSPVVSRRFNTNDSHYAAAYVLDDPQEGTHNITITLDTPSGSESTVVIPINVQYCTDAPTGDTGTGTSTSGDASLNTTGLTTTGTNSLCLAFAVYAHGGSDPFTGGGGLTELIDGSTGISATQDIAFWLASISVSASATSVLPTVTPTTDDDWGMVAVEILAI